MIVRFFEMLREGDVVVGDIRIEKGKLVIDPEDRHALVNLISEPFRIPAKGPTGWYDVMPADQPERFLKNCIETYRGTYFWCKEIKG